MSAKRSDAKLYEKFKVTAPEMLAQIIQVLALCHKLDIHVPRGVKNLFEFTWEELTVTTQRKAITGEYCPVVHLVPTMESSFSSTTYKSHTGRKSIPKGTMSEPSYLSPSAENQQILLKFQRRSVHLLSELLKLKMKVMIDSVTGCSSDEVTRKFLEAGQLLCPKNQEEAAELMAQAPKKRASHSTCKAIPISSTIQLIHQVSVSCLTFSLASKENKLPKAPGYPKFKPMQEVINVDHQNDPCPEARQKLREMCRHIEEEKAAMKAKGHTKPLIVRNYTTVLGSPSISPRKGGQMVPLPTEHKPKPPKLYFAFPDGTAFIFYPTGNIAACQFPMCCVGKTITLLFNNAPSLALLASFIADYQACVRYSFKASCSLALMMDLEGGAVRDRDGYLTHKWSWASKTQTLQSLEFQINEQLKLKVLGQNSITLSFSCLNETVNMSLSRAPCAHTPKADKRILAKASDSEAKEQQLERALEEIKKRFQKTVKQFINAILIASGMIPIEYPILEGAKYIKFKRKEPSSQAWAKRVKEERAPIASETKRPQKPPSRPIDQRIPPKPSRRPVDQRKPSSHLDTMTQPKPAPRVKTVSAAGARPASIWASSIADCPVVLRRLLSKQDAGLGCKCVVKIPFVTDLEFDKFISAPRKSDQILVIFVLSSQNPSYSPFLEWMLQSLYMEKQHGRPSPCVQCRCDPYRLLRYDMDSVMRRKPPLPPLLVRKHAVTPGMVLMYAGGKLLFGGCVFNGYGCSKKDLLKQIGQARLDCKMGHFLPESFKFSAIPVEDPDQDKLKSQQDSVETASEEPSLVPKRKDTSLSKLKILKTLTAMKCIFSMQEQQKQKKNPKPQIAQAKDSRKNSDTRK
ncbi:gastrin-releasing peptide [Platysternon megacephalum]|uniref:Gastrin-releasing peptide n=1 Tax=Platysternon megacephalum TaxID=55544 RepID=A0A4D9EYN5_9SAUR|nr:gastrin-releasing peptide [Platysternon megacephalum]